MNILSAIRRLAERGAGNVKELKDKGGEKRLRVVITASGSPEEHPDALHIHAVKKNRRDALSIGLSAVDAGDFAVFEVELEVAGGIKGVGDVFDIRVAAGDAHAAGRVAEEAGEFFAGHART